MEDSFEVDEAVLHFESSTSGFCNKLDLIPTLQIAPEMKQMSEKMLRKLIFLPYR